MSFSKYGIATAAVVIACLLFVPSVAAQNRSITVQSNTGDAFLGIAMEDVTASNMSEYELTDEKGAIVRSVQEGSPAEEAGFRENDVVLQFGGESVWSTRQLSRLVSETPVGRRVAITISRDGKPVNLSATLRARTESRAENRSEQRFFEGIPGGQLERFFESLPPGIQIYPPAPDSRARPPRAETPGGRQGAERPEQRPRLGVETQPLTEQMAEYMGVTGRKGVLITSVLVGSASEGKLKAGDVVIGVNNRDVASPADLTNFVSEASGEIDVKVIRDKKQITVRINLSSDENDENQGGGYRL